MDETANPHGLELWRTGTSSVTCSISSPNCTTVLAKFASAILVSNGNDEESLLNIQIQSQINPPKLQGYALHPFAKLFH